MIKATSNVKEVTDYKKKKTKKKLNVYHPSFHMLLTQCLVMQKTAHFFVCEKYTMQEIKFIQQNKIRIIDQKYHGKKSFNLIHTSMEENKDPSIKHKSYQIALSDSYSEIFVQCDQLCLSIHSTCFF